MRVLIGFEESGVVREAFSARGHDAWSCDLQPSRKPGQHIQNDIYIALNSAYGPWDLIIIHPECTALTVSGNHVYAEGKPKYKERLASLNFIEKLWDACCYYAPLVALENPIGVIATQSRLGKCSQTIQPYQFGHDVSKNTCLWLRDLPLLTGTCYVPPRRVQPGNKARWSNQTDSGQNKLGPSTTRKRERAETYQGIADAMADQWGKLTKTTNIEDGSSNGSV